MSAENSKYIIQTVSDPQDFKKCIDIRIKVFVLEQACPPETEPDSKDPTCAHFLISLRETNVPIATARLVPSSNTEIAKPGRICILKEWRGKGIGSLLLDKIHEEARNRGIKKLEIHAQLDKVGFYSKAGYVKTDGDVFMEDGIPHVEMIKLL